VNYGLVVNILSQDDKVEQIMDKRDETDGGVTDESDKKELGSELAHEDMDIAEGSGEDESADCILEDVLLIDSDDGIDEDTTPGNETDKVDSKPCGINVFVNDILYSRSTQYLYENSHLS